MADKAERDESLVGIKEVEDTEETSLLRNEDKGLIDCGKPIRTYWWRWTTLAIFGLNFVVFNCFWFTFAPIANVIQCYYNVGQFWVNSLSLVIMVVYVVLMFPSAWCLDKLGLRTSTVLASCATALGAGLRLAGAGKAGYTWTIVLDSVKGLKSGVAAHVEGVNLPKSGVFGMQSRLRFTSCSALCNDQKDCG